MQKQEKEIMITPDNIMKQSPIEESSIFQFIQIVTTNYQKWMGFDLQDLMILMNEYYIELRKSLELNSNITFGLEIEFESANCDKIFEQLNSNFQQNNWDIFGDK